MEQPTSEWPPMAEPEFGEDNLSIDGTFPISVVNIGSWGANNKPMAWIQSAGCAYCDRWAVGFYVGAERTGDGELFNCVERRLELTLVYACDQHQDTAAHELVEKYGSATNQLDLDLPHAVERRVWRRSDADPA